MKCANCEYNDGMVYTSLPPKYRCTITNEFHFGDDNCNVDFAPVIRCKDCKWYNEEDLFCWYWAELYGHADATPRCTPFDYCFRGVRKDGGENER